MPQDHRKCTKCKEKIFFDLDNISGIVRFNNLFYHSNCFVEYCKGRAAKSGSPIWQERINNMTPFEDAAKEKINYKKTKDDFNIYLLQHYDVTEIPTRFWNIIADLENGNYKQKKCNPVSIKILFEAWKWGQAKLDSINRKNRMNNIGPKNDEQRLFYDLAILVGKVPLYLKAKTKREMAEIEMKRNADYTCNEVDINQVGKAKTEVKENVSDIFNDLYIE